MVTKYYSNDGKCFTNKQDCLNYENELNIKLKEETKKKEERDTRWKEVQDAYKKFDELSKKYYEDFLKNEKYSWVNEIFSEIFGW